MKKKHNKQIKKNRQKKEEERKKNEPEIDFDTSAYVVYNRLEMTYPCLSFDIVTDEFGSGVERVSKFPISLNLIAGAQTPPHVENNYVYVMKVNNIRALKQEDETVKDEESEEEDETEDDPNNLPKLTSVRVAHKGCVNRLRVNKVGGRTLTATWSDRGKVHIYDLTTPIQAVSDQKSINTYTAQKVDPKPIFTFGGHLSEGYALDWAPLRLGSLATGDCKKNIHIWTMKSTSDWNVDQHPLVGHEESVEDIKWSPNEADILASCSVDKSVRIWDLRQPTLTKCVICVKDSHKSDVNVIDWNRKSKDLIVSGGDDGVVKVWDVRYLGGKSEPFPVAQFDYHKKPITSVEWDPNDDTVMAVASEDDRLTLWDLAVEKDEEHEEGVSMEVDIKPEETKNDEDISSLESESEEDEDEEEEDDEEDQGETLEDGVEYGELNFKQIPEQMLFLHQGQAEIKELHWHPQLNGLIVSTALNGINIFKTISA